MKKLYFVTIFLSLFINIVNLNAHQNLNNQLIKAVADGLFEVVPSLLEQGADVYVIDREGQTLLMIAAWLGSKQGVKLFLQKGVNVNAVDNYNTTALMFAVMSESKDVVKLLLKAKADVNVVNSVGRTALMLAVKSRNKEIVALLLKAGADIHPADDKGFTATDFAQVDSDIKKILQSYKDLEFVEFDQIFS